MDLKKYLKEQLETILQKHNLSWPTKGVLNPPTDPKFGDLSTNLALVTAKEVNLPPRKWAEEIQKELSQIEFIQNIEVAGPGFINFTFTPQVWQKILLNIFQEKENFGRLSLGKGKKVQIEYVSANPTGPLHIGHGRGAALGDSLARIMRFAGFEVTTEYYINDAGRQINLLGRSVWSRYKELLGEKVNFPEDGYKGTYIYDIAREIIELKGKNLLNNEEEGLKYCTEYAKDKILEDIKDDLKNFRVEHQIWFSEKSLVQRGEVEKTLTYLQEKGFSYEKDGALWLKTSLWGDDKDRVLKKSSGDLTYFASDIAYHADKFARGFDLVVDIWGADHHGYIPRMKAAIQALGKSPEQLQVILVQLVNLLREGKPVAMSTRAGEFVTLREVYSEVGVDAARFIFLTRKSDSHLDFDLELVKKRSLENPVYYVQYAHARICSLLEKAKEKNISYSLEELENNLHLLNTKEDLDLLKCLAKFPETISICAENLSPHHLSFYLQELASLLHRYYNEHKILDTNNLELTKTRINLFLGVKQILKTGLFLLGVEAPNRM